MTNTPNIDRLVTALKQVDDGEYIAQDGHGITLDGHWEAEPLEGALATHFAAPAPLIEIKRVDPDALFLREGWISGTAEDGTQVELERTFGRTLIFRLTKPDGTRIVETLDVADLLQRWANRVDS